MKILALLLIAPMAYGQLCSGVSLGRTITPTFSTPSGTLGPGGQFNGFVRFPGSAVYTDISASAVDTHSASWVCAVRNCNGLGGGPAGGVDRQMNTAFNIVDTDSFLTAWNGIPWQVFDSGATKIQQSFTAPDGNDSRSDPGPYPGTLVYPLVNGSYGPGSSTDFTYSGDKQIWSLDRDSCIFYRSYNNYYIPPAGTRPLLTGVGSVWDAMGGDHQRPYGIPSGSVSGMAGLETLYTYEELQAGIAQEMITPGTGTIGHALAFTAMGGYLSSMSYTGMASSHQFSGPWLATTPPFGAILRLRAGYDGSGFRIANRVLINTMKKFGIVFIDGGSFGLYPATDTRWNGLDTLDLRNLLLTAADWDFIQAGPIYCDASESCGLQPPTGPSPVIGSFTASASTGAGSAVTLSWSGISGLTNSNIAGIDPDVAGVRGTSGTATVHPAATTTYTLWTQNSFGRTMATTTVSVPVCCYVP